MMRSGLDNGVSASGTTRVVDNDTTEWAWVAWDRDGQIAFQLNGRTTRIKPPAKKKSYRPVGGAPSGYVILRERSV